MDGVPVNFLGDEGEGFKIGEELARKMLEEENVFLREVHVIPVTTRARYCQRRAQRWSRRAAYGARKPGRRFQRARSARRRNFGISCEGFPGWDKALRLANLKHIGQT